MASSCSTLWLTVSPRAAGAGWLSPGQALKSACSNLPWEVGGPGASLRVAEHGHRARDNMTRVEVGQPSKTLLPKQQPQSPLPHFPHLQALPPLPFAEGVGAAAEGQKVLVRRPPQDCTWGFQLPTPQAALPLLQQPGPRHSISRSPSGLCSSPQLSPTLGSFPSSSLETIHSAKVALYQEAGDFWKSPCSMLTGL